MFKYRQNDEVKKKIDCRLILNNAFRFRLKKKNICETCGASPTQCHHEDYNKPLEYIELCIECHNKLHNPK